MQFIKLELILIFGSKQQQQKILHLFYKKHSSKSIG